MAAFTMTCLKWGRWAAVAAVLAGGLSACVVVPADSYYGGGYGGAYGGGYGGVVTTAPPGPQYEVATVAPGPGYFWIGGFWNWVGNRHVWTGGRWEAHRPGYHWAPHRWQRESNGWRAAPGHWQRG